MRVTSARESESARKAGCKMKHAVIMTGGKQYRVAENDVIYVEKLNVADGETVTFDQVLARSSRPERARRSVSTR